MPEYLATSLWSDSHNAYKDLGINLDYKDLNLSEDLIGRLEKFDDSIMDLIDWSAPAGKSPLSKEEREAIWNEGQLLLERIRVELIDDFEVIDESAWVKLGADN